MFNSRSSLGDGWRALTAAASGGALAGALVGTAEAALITATAAPEEWGLFPFAIATYGFFGASIGATGWLGLAVAAALTSRGPVRSPLALGFGLAFTAALLPVGRYHIVQRVFREGLSLTSGTGIAVHAAWAALVLVLAAGSFFGLRSSARGPRSTLVATIVWVGGFAFAAAISHAIAPLDAGLAPRPAASSGSAGASDVHAGRASGHPNIILIVVDTLRFDAAPVQGDASATGVGRLAMDGVTFTRAHAQSSWTRPSMASLFTSQYAIQHQAIHKTDVLREEAVTLAEVLRDAGYWTAGIVTNINLAPIFQFQQGFAEYHYLAPHFYFGASDSATRLALYKGLRVVRETLLRQRIHASNYYQDAEVVAAAIDTWIASAPPQPFFLFLHYMDPHDPYFEMPYNGRGVARVSDQNPHPTRSDELHALYGQGVEYVEWELVRLIERLQELGLYGDSIIALTSDHGEEFQEHGGWWHGATLYQEQLHVPLVIKSPGFAAGRRDDRIVQLVDVAPTLLAAAGVEVPPEFVGRDLHRGDDWPVVFAETDHEGHRLTALRRDDWKVIVANPDNPRGFAPVELYDLGRDPGERTNLADVEPEQAEAMMLELARLRALLRHRR